LEIGLAAWALDILTIALECCVALVVWRHARHWFSLIAYMLGMAAWQGGASIVLLVCKQEYFYTYWIGREIVFVLEAMVVAQFASRYVAKMTFLPRFLTRGGVILGLLTCATILLVAISHPIFYRDPLTRLVLNGEWFLSCAEAVLFVAIVVCAELAPGIGDATAKLVGTILAIQICSQILFNTLLQVLSFSHVSLISDLVQGRDILLLCAWIFAFRRPVAARVAQLSPAALSGLRGEARGLAARTRWALFEARKRVTS
jgi:hypothetical protein